MARIRSVHPGLFTDEAFVTLSDAAQIFLIGLWTEADDQGVFEWKPTTLRMRLRGAKDGSVEPLLSELVEANCIRSYEMNDRQLGAIRNFRRFQKPKTPNATHLTTEDIRNYVGLSPVVSEKHPPQRAPFPPKGEKSSLMEDGGGGGEDGDKPNGLLGAHAPPKQPRGTRWEAGKPVPSDWIAEAADIRKKAGLGPINANSAAEKFVDFWVSKPGQGGTKLDWHATWRNWVRDTRSFGPPPSSTGQGMGPA